MNLTIESALIYVHPEGNDEVSLRTNLPPPRAGMFKCFLDFECDHGTGARYVKKNFGIASTVLHVKDGIIK